jgi:membrane protease YdiL (CAAX protease family)
MDTQTLLLVLLIVGLALACQAAETRDARDGSRPGAATSTMRFVVVLITVFLLLNAAVTLLAAAAGQGAGNALGLNVSGDRSHLVAEGALGSVAGLVTLALFATGTSGVPGVRRLRQGRPISWLALALFLQSLAGNLAPARAEATVAATAGSPERASNLILGVLPFGIIAIASVGPGVRRGASATLQRLGVLPLHPAWWLLAVGVGAALVLVGTPAVDLANHLSPMDCVVQQQQVARSLQGVSRSVSEQLGIAIAAGVCEELLFRGALQPRFGVFLSSLLWASYHLQYTCHGFPSVANLYILALGLLFGGLRNRGGLLAAIAAHATYDATILLDIADRSLLGLAGVTGSAGLLLMGARRARPRTPRTAQAGL